MKKLVLISGGIVFLALLSVGGAYFYHVKHDSKPKPPSLAELAKLQVELPQVMTNTDDGHLVQTTLTLQAENKTTFKDLTDAQSQILDIINTAIHNNNSSEFLSSDGVSTFKAQVLKQIIAILPPKDSVGAIDVDSMVEQ